MEKPLNQRIGERILIKEAARIKGCTTNAIRNAIGREEITGIAATPMSHAQVVINSAFINWKVAEWGGRLHKKGAKANG